MDPIHVGLNMHCFFKDVDVNLLESLKELYFLPYPHFPLPCCVLSSLHTMLANHIFWTAFMSHLLLLQKTEISQCCAAVWMYISIHCLSCQPCTAQPLSYNSIWGSSTTSSSNRVPEVYIQQWAQPHLYSNFTIMAFHTANCPISRNCHYTTKQQSIMLPQWKMW